jgi:fermentation-respiration switch protein FrsA (DUF1100 family)
VKKRLVAIVGLLLFAVVGFYCVELAIPKHDYFIERVGSLYKVDQSSTVTETAVSESVQLESSTGLKVDMRVVRPAVATSEPLPLVLLLGGHGTGKNAVDLVGEPQDIAYAAIDYPYTGSQSLDGIVESLGAAPKIQKAFIDTPPALSLALSWALKQAWVDSSRIELVGVSLGVPFTAAAGATDARFTRVWLLHGGIDNASWVAHAGRKNIDNETLRRVAARAALFFVYGNSFNTEHWMREIAPRPLIIVAACNDDYVPPEALRPLAGLSPNVDIEVIWTTGLHIGPRRTHELQQLMDIVTGRIRGNPSPAPSDCAGFD